MPSRPKNEIRVRLTIAAFQCSPLEITKTLEIEPTKAWLSGERISVTSRRYRENGWRLEADLPSTSSVQEQIEWLLDRIEGKASAVKSIPGAILEFGCVIYANEYIPEIYLPADLMARMASIGANFDVDLYAMMEAYREDASA